VSAGGEGNGYSPIGVCASRGKGGKGDFESHVDTRGASNLLFRFSHGSPSGNAGPNREDLRGFARVRTSRRTSARTNVDLQHNTIHVHRSIERVRGRSGSTKSDRARRVPIEPALLPLLQALQIEAKATGAVFRMPSVGVLSGKLKLYLRRAGVDRGDLFVTDATRKAMTFHDLRATGITWCAVRGDEPLKIMQRAGHADFETTRIYLREAENLAANFGQGVPAPSGRAAEPAVPHPGSFGVGFGVSASAAHRRAGNKGVSCGADGNRTRDLLHAMQALSQLSYSPG